MFFDILIWRFAVRNVEGGGGRERIQFISLAEQNCKNLRLMGCPVIEPQVDQITA